MTNINGQVALVFPGQGCQSVGMGADIYQSVPAAREMLDRADQILDINLSTLCWEGPQETLNDTANTQPAIYATTLAIWTALGSKIDCAQVACVAGHSLGEFSALAVAGAIDYEDGLRLVRRRGEAMRDAGNTAPGGMAVIIGLADEVVAELVAEANGDAEPEVWIANYNSPGQVVIAGGNEALGRAVELAKERKARRALPLAVSVACHTPYMRAAADRLAEALDATAFHAPWAPVVCNADAVPIDDPAAIKDALLRQLYSPVRWVESIRGMVDGGVTHIIEVGPKAVVSGLVKRIHRPTKLQSVTDLASLQAFEMGEG